MSRVINRVLLCKKPTKEIYEKISENIKNINELVYISTVLYSDAYLYNSHISLYNFDDKIKENYIDYFGLSGDNNNDYKILFYLNQDLYHGDKKRFTKDLNDLFRNLIKGIDTENLYIINIDNWSGDVRKFTDNNITTKFKGIQL